MDADEPAMSWYMCNGGKYDPVGETLEDMLGSGWLGTCGGEDIVCSIASELWAIAATVEVATLVTESGPTTTLVLLPCSRCSGSIELIATLDDDEAGELP